MFLYYLYYLLLFFAYKTANSITLQFTNYQKAKLFFGCFYYLRMYKFQQYYFCYVPVFLVHTLCLFRFLIDVLQFKKENKNSAHKKTAPEKIPKRSAKPNQPLPSGVFLSFIYYWINLKISSFKMGKCLTIVPQTISSSILS